MLASSMNLLALALLASLSQAQTNSEVFFQFVGDSTVTKPTATGDADSTTLLDLSFTACTNDLYALPVLTDLPKSQSADLQSVAVDGVCLLCTSLGITRIDSCCGEASASACFDKSPKKTPASANATPTASSTGKSSATASGSSNAGAIIKANDVGTGSVVALMMGLVRLIL